MVRTQIQLTDKQSKQLKTMALSEGVSIAELIRRSVDQYTRGHRQQDREELKRRSLLVIGKYHSGLDDVGENHDRYLADIYAEVGE
jgi:hypothetical protein